MTFLRPALFGIVLTAIALGLSRSMLTMRFDMVIVTALVIAAFVFVFVRTEAGLYLVLFSMLLSPEIALGAAGLAESRAVVLRLEDLLLIVIALGWFAKTALNKEMGLVVKTPLNRWILLYALATLLATLMGYLTGTVKTAAGFFYVLKYVEYFAVYYLTVNNLRDRPHIWRLVTAAFVTAAIVSLISAAQIPGGERVTAPFEGDSGEPNTLGGYLLLTIAIAAGIALETPRLRVRVLAAGLVALMALPFCFTLSRASYLGVIPMIVALCVLSTRRKLMIAVLVLLLGVSPLLLPSLLPKVVKQRILYTFEPEKGQAVVRLGKVGFDPSTSERLQSMQRALEGWMERPLLGHGVTGFRFMDAQYARTLVEMGVIGLAAFLALLWAILKAGFHSFRHVHEPEDRGLVLGFLAGTIGLLFHAIGSNTFIIVRIMEPFWFFAGVVVALPMLAGKPEEAPTPRPVQAFRYSV